MNKKLKSFFLIMIMILLIVGMLFMINLTMITISVPKSSLLEGVNIKYNVGHPDYNDESVEQFIVSSYNNRYYRISLKITNLDPDIEYMLFQDDTYLTNGFSLFFGNITEKVFSLVVFKADFGLYKLTNDWYQMIVFESI